MYCCFHIWSISHSLQYLLAAFREAKPSISPMLRFWSFLRHRMDTPTLCFLLSPVAEFLNLYVFSWSYNTSNQLQKSSLSFSQNYATAQVFSSFALQTLACFLHVLPQLSPLTLVADLSSTHSQLNTEWETCREDMRALHVPEEQLEWQQVRSSQWLVGGPPNGVHSKVSRNHLFNALLVSYMPLSHSSYSL